MIEIVFRGRLGNQMFQYAYGSALAARLGVPLKADFSWYFRSTTDSFDLWRFRKTGYRPVTVASQIPGRVVEKLGFLRGLRDYEMYESRFDPLALRQADGTRLHGWFQSVRYFADHGRAVRDVLDLSPFTPASDLAALRGTADGAPLVALHVRRGDYVGNPDFFLGDYDAYYRRALEHMRGALGREPFLVVVSDDPQWCREWPLLAPFAHAVYPPSGRSDLFVDLALMAACDHNIITNSSFSWWAAWLGQPDGRQVVMPNRWFPDRTTDQCDMGVPGWTQL
jgi:hypothetical protein